MLNHYFQGETYNDDRMYVLCIARCTIAPGRDDTTETTVYWDNIPTFAQWCVVTYRNTERYRAIRVDRFKSPAEAQRFLEQIEPTVPRISLGGRSPERPLSFDAWKAWKKDNGLNEYDPRSMYAPGGKNTREVVITKNQK